MSAQVEIIELDSDAAYAYAEQLAELLLEAHAAGQALGLRAPLTRQRARAEWRRLATALDGHSRILFAALRHDAIVGAMHLARSDADNGRHRAELQRLSVRKSERGRGIGSALLEAATARAAELGLRLLWATTHAGTKAEAFYLRAGWRLAGFMPLYSERPDGQLVTNAFFFRVIDSHGDQPYGETAH